MSYRYKDLNREFLKMLKREIGRRHVIDLLVILLVSLVIPLTALADGILIFGGTGQLGAPHVRMLVDQGERVTVFHRATSSFERLEGVDFQRVEGDLMDASSVLAAMEKIQPEVVIDASARRGNRMREQQAFYAIAMQNIVAAAQVTGVEQIILHGSIGVRGSADYLEKTYGYNTDSPNMLDKAEAERVLENSGVNYTIVRNGLLEFEPVEPTGGGELLQDENTFGRITRTDLARLTVGCVNNDDCYGTIFHAIDAGLVGPRPAREAARPNQ
ncbi:MAG: SDR family oxidoreductase [Woeseiaceae bacterium]